MNIITTKETINHRYIFLVLILFLALLQKNIMPCKLVIQEYAYQK